MSEAMQALGGLERDFIAGRCDLHATNEKDAKDAKLLLLGDLELCEGRERQEPDGNIKDAIADGDIVVDGMLFQALCRLRLCSNRLEPACLGPVGRGRVALEHVQEKGRDGVAEDEAHQHFGEDGALSRLQQTHAKDQDRRLDHSNGSNVDQRENPSSLQQSVLFELSSRKKRTLGAMTEMSPSKMAASAVWSPSPAAQRPVTISLTSPIRCGATYNTARPRRERRL